MSHHYGHAVMKPQLCAYIYTKPDTLAEKIFRMIRRIANIVLTGVYAISAAVIITILGKSIGIPSPLIAQLSASVGFIIGFVMFI